MKGRLPSPCPGVWCGAVGLDSGDIAEPQRWCAATSLSSAWSWRRCSLSWRTSGSRPTRAMATGRSWTRPASSKQVGIRAPRSRPVTPGP